MADDSDHSENNSIDNNPTCPICDRWYSSTLSLRRHIKDCHPQATLAQLNIRGNYFYECHACHGFFCGRRGLTQHYQRSRCEAPRRIPPHEAPGEAMAPVGEPVAVVAAPAVIPAHAQAAQPPIPPVDTFLTQNDLTLSDLVASYHQGLYFIRKNWRDRLTQVCIRLLEKISRSRRNARSAPRSTAAFLLLPGLIRSQQIQHQNIPDFLNRLLSDNHTCIVEQILQAAVEYYRPAHMLAPQQPRSKRQVKRGIESLVDIGRYGAALARCEDLDRLYTAGGAEPPRLDIDEQRRIIQTLHPPASPEDALPLDGEAAPMVTLTADEVAYGLRALKPSSAPGWSGWTNRAIFALAFTGNHSDAFREAVLSLATAFVNNLLPRGCYDLFIISRAVLIPKDAGGWRPLGIGEAWYRFFSRLLCRKYLPNILPQMLPLQLGCGVSGGSEICARLTALAHAMDNTEHGDYAIASLDVRNAFNSVRRSAILQGVRRFCPPLERWFRAAYGSASDLRSSEGLSLGTSQTGVRQGDPLSSLCFCLAFHPILERIQALLNDVQEEGLPVDSPRPLCWAYADDITICAPAAVLQDVCCQLSPLFDSFDLHLVPEKCTMLGRRMAGFHPPAFPVANDGIKKIMGCPIGSTRYCLAELQRTLQRMADPIPTLHRIQPQSAFLLLTRCINARASYLSNTLEVAGMLPLLQEFDARIVAAIVAVADCQSTPLTTSIVHLPRANGGLGVCAHGGLMGDVHRVESRNRTLEFTQKHFPSLLPAAHRWSSLPLQHHPTYSVANPRSTTQADHDHTMRFFQSILSAGDVSRRALAAWFRSSCYRGSGRWLDWRGDVTRRFRFSSTAFTDALRSRLLIPTGRLPMAPVHRCRGRDVSMENEPFHLLDCQSNQFWFQRRHNKVRDLLADYIATCWPDAQVDQEVNLHHADGSHCRADLIVRRGHATYVLDVAITNPGCRSALRLESALREDAAARGRERAKEEHYSDVQEIIEGVRFVPVVFEATGRVGPRARSFFAEVVGDHTLPLSQFLSQVSAVVALYNAWMLAGARALLRGPQRAEA